MRASRHSRDHVHSLRYLLALAVTLACSTAHAQIQEDPDFHQSSVEEALVKQVYQEGLELLKTGNCEDAERKLGNVLRRASQDPNINFLKGMTLRCQQDHRAAAILFKRAVRYDRSMYVAYKYLGMSYLDLGQPRKAGELLERLETFRDRCQKECSDELNSAHAELRAAIDSTSMN